MKEVTFLPFGSNKGKDRIKKNPQTGGQVDGNKNKRKRPLNDGVEGIKRKDPGRKRAAFTSMATICSL